MVEESAIAKRSQHVIETASRGYAGVLFSEEPKKSLILKNRASQRPPEPKKISYTPAPLHTSLSM